LKLFGIAATALALALTLGGAAAASDARLTQRLYAADEVVRIDGRLGVQAAIAFAADEHIENVAVGDANSWQITPNKRANLLFVKPLAATARTNMTVVSDRRTYFFDLVASPRAAPIYALSFRYPDEPKVAAGAGAVPSLTEAERQALDPAEAPLDPAQLNFAWRTSGASKLLPQRLYDDGTATYAVWADKVPIPAILVTNAKGEEGPVNFSVRGETIVIDGVPSRLILRAGRDRAQLDYAGDARRTASRQRPGSETMQPQAAAPAVATANGEGGVVR
jgi:type IV secretion system protein VirB9